MGDHNEAPSSVVCSSYPVQVGPFWLVSPNGGPGLGKMLRIYGQPCWRFCFTHQTHSIHSGSGITVQAGDHTVGGQCSIIEACSPINVPAPCCGRDSWCSRSQGSVVAALIVVPKPLLRLYNAIHWNVLGINPSPVKQMVDAVLYFVKVFWGNQFQKSIMHVLV